MAISIVERLKRLREIEGLARDSPSFAEWLATVREHYGEDWDPESLLARRVRAVRYTELFLEDLADARATLGGAVPEALTAHYFDETRDVLAAHCDPAFVGFAFDEARKDLHAKAGPMGAAGLIARWSVRRGAFGELGQDWHAAANRFRNAVADVRRRRTRTRAK